MNLCDSLKKQLRSLFAGYRSVEDHVETALRITCLIKNWLSSPVADVITAIIPGTTDDAIRARLVAVLDKSIMVLRIMDTCRDATTIDEKVRCYAEQIARQTPELRDALLAKLASLITSGLHGDKLTRAKYDLYTQTRFTLAKND